MSDHPASSFGKFVPGFDFLQNLAKGASQGLPQMPQLANWVAPTLSVEELDKRIAELRAVQFWLDQNATALKATIQALEVQKMTLATLQGMNVSMQELAGAFQPKAMPADAPPAPRAAERRVEKAPEPPPVADAQPEGAGGPEAAPGVIDPLKWWGALTQQFQEIASTALREAAAKAVPDTAPARTRAAAAPAPKRAAAKSGTARKAPARKSAGR